MLNFSLNCLSNKMNSVRKKMGGKVKILRNKFHRNVKIFLSSLITLKKNELNTWTQFILFSNFNYNLIPKVVILKKPIEVMKILQQDALPKRFAGERSFSTAIYYLLQKGDRSVFHRIKSDECWHFYEGGPLLVHVIETNGNYYFVKLGKDIAAGETFQFVVPKNTWFASEPAPGSSFSLAGCTRCAGF